MADVATKLRFALALARNGFYIFPLRPNTKRPFKGSWSESMTRDPQTIREWFGVSADINYAVVPGEDYVILDIDAPKKSSDVDGREVWAELELEQEQWVTDNTFTVKTPRGGFHYYLSVGQPASNAHRFPEGIDVRGAMGYALGPGSEIDGKDYTAPNRKIKIAPAPIWVVNRLRSQADKDERHDEPLFELDTPAAISRASEFLDRRSPAIEGRNGNDHTYATVCQVKDFGVSADECLALLTHREGWNERCDPPWDTAELARLIDNAYRYGQHRPGAKGGALLEQFEDASEGQAPEPDADDPYAKLRGITYRGGDILHRDTRREMIIPEWLPAHGLLAILAKRGAGKTVSMLDVALRLALDMDWHGSPAAEGWYAVYLCGEDDVGAEEQIRAWCRHHGVSKPPQRFIFLAGIVDLLSAGDTKLWAEYLKKEVIGAHKAIVFLDTWQRASSRGSQSDDGDMQLAVHHTEAMARSLGGPAVVAFHPPKHDDNVVMGSSIIENSTTAIWTLSENARGRRLEVSRIKGKGVGNYSLFQFEEIGLGEEDDFGRERSGIVPRKIGGTEFSELDDPQVAHSYQRTLAEVVREVDVQQKAKDPKARLMTANAMAREIGNLPTVAVDDASEDTREWATGLLAKLRGAGFTTISHRTIRKALLELFDDPRGHDFEDGYVLRLKSKGRQRYFVIEPSGI